MVFANDLARYAIVVLLSRSILQTWWVLSQITSNFHIPVFSLITSTTPIIRPLPVINVKTKFTESRIIIGARPSGILQIHVAVYSTCAKTNYNIQVCVLQIHRAIYSPCAITISAIYRSESCRYTLQYTVLYPGKFPEP